MSRVKIDTPSTFSFSIKIPVRITDVNYGGHVGNDTILSLMHEARMQFLNAHGYSELAFEGIGLIMSDVAIEFKDEVFYGDTILASVVAGNFSRVSFNIFYRFEVNRKDTAKLVAVGKSGMVGYDYKLKKVASISQAAVNRLSS